MCDLVFSIQEFLKLVPGLVLFPFSLYFAWKKIGTNVSVSYAIHHEHTLAPRISSVILTNHKDKPLTVFSIHAVIGRTVAYEVDKFEPPLVIKPLESLQIEPRPYSNLYLGDEPYVPDFARVNELEIYISVPNKVVFCKGQSAPHFHSFKQFDGYQFASKSTRTFNGLVYNDDAVFAITYKTGSAVATAIVDKSGFICRGWTYQYNMIPPEYMKSKADVKKYLELANFEKLADWFVIDELAKT